jgi:hypothetical protein
MMRAALAGTIGPAADRLLVAMAFRAILASRFFVRMPAGVKFPYRR